MAVRQNITMKYLIFDLDNTIYPKEIGVFKLVDQRINDYMRMKLGLDHGFTETLRLKYMDKYGTTLGGLIVHHKVDPDEYLNFVHDIDLEGFLVANPELRKLMERLQIEKVIFTNGSSSHADRVLQILGINDYFSRIFDIKFMNYLAKPDPRSYRKLLDVLAVEGKDCLIVEDLARNLLPAKELGMTTVLIGEEETTCVDFVIKDILDLDNVLNEID